MPRCSAAFTPRRQRPVVATLWRGVVGEDVGDTMPSQLVALEIRDRAIHDACAIVAYFAFVNRIADGLGVDLEP